MRTHGQVVRVVLMMVPTAVVLTAALSLAPETAYGQVRNVHLTWVDRTGDPIETVGKPAGYSGLDLSPDGTRVAIHRNDGDGSDIWGLSGFPNDI